ncbi:MAG: inositol monophosphatase family protein, partial [Candidatus Nanoarchaeia archaeon]
MKGAYNILADIKYVAALAGEKTLMDQNQLKLKTKKNRKDIVTKADSRAEELILSGLVGYGFNILTEEKGYIDRKSECTFIVDPIEGTTNYSQGHPDWAVSIGLQEGDKMVAGAVYSASDKKMYSAIRGKGAFLNGSKIRVSNKDKLEDSFINAAYLDDMSRFNILMAPIWDKS